MSAGILLIDGYNLLHAAGMGQSDYGPGDLLRCRMRLLRFLLSKLSAAEIKGTTVVFDARDPPPDRPAEVIVSGLRVLFANPGGDADALIQNWLTRHPSPRRLTLVSSDRVLQRTARNCGAKFIGSEDFVHDLERRRASRTAERGRTAIADDSKPAPLASAEQTAYWLKVFGDIPVVEPDSEDKAAVPAEPPRARQPRPETSTIRRPRKRPPSPASPEDSKREGAVAGEELAYWMRVFGGQAAAGSASASPEELRLSDLENWLKTFEAAEAKAAKKRR